MQLEQITLRSARINKNLRQTDVAKILGVNKKTVGSWESGKTKPGIKYIDPICELYGVNYNQIKWNN